MSNIVLTEEHTEAFSILFASILIITLGFAVLKLFLGHLFSWFFVLVPSALVFFIFILIFIFLLSKRLFKILFNKLFKVQ